MEIKNKLTIFCTLLLVLLTLASISAFGIGIVYSNENPLRLYPGESSEVLINLQSNKDIQLKGSILEGDNIAEFLDSSDVYNVPNGWVNAKLKVSMPAGASIGEEKTITLNFQQVSEANAGTIGFSTAIEKSFKVLVVEKPAVETPQAEGISAIWWILGIIVVIAIIALIWFVIKSRKE